jgi:hypothetical protein
VSGKPLDDIDADSGRLDDRWTATKLYKAGYELEFERTCRTCGDEIEAYKNLTTGKWLFLDATVLSPHRCDGT